MQVVEEKGRSMAKLPVFNMQKEQVGEIDVKDEVFGVEPKIGVLHEVVQWQMAKRRAGTASTKRRSEVSGGGRKPWRQKGTGHARAGSNTSPLWRRGGSVFGPKPRSYFYPLPKKVRKLGVRMALSDRVRSDRVYVVRDLGLEEIKTRRVAEFMGRFEVEKVLLVTRERDRVLELSARNIPYVTVLPQAGLNVYDILRHDHLILAEDAVSPLEERLLS